MLDKADTHVEYMYLETMYRGYKTGASTVEGTSTQTASKRSVSRSDSPSTAIAILSKQPQQEERTTTRQTRGEK